MKIEHKLNDAQRNFVQASLKQIQAQETAQLVALGQAQQHQTQRAAIAAGLENTLRMIMESERLTPPMELSADGTALIGDVPDAPTAPDANAPPALTPALVNGIGYERH
jgi:hypothetical protein